MKQKLLLALMLLLTLLTLTACAKKEEETKEEPKNEEVEITDQNLKDNLEMKSNILYNIGKIDGGGLGTFFTTNTKLGDLKDEDKLTAILIYANLNSKKIEHEAITQEIYKKYLNNWFGEKVTDKQLADEITTFYTLDGQTINDIFKNLYNTDISNYDNKVGCPNFKYYKDINKYLAICTCGNSGEDFLYTYNYKYTKDNDSAYVYVSLAVLNNDDGKIYSDYEKTKVYQEDPTGFAITEENYQDLAQYKLKFSYNKDTKEYNFSELTKVN